MKPIPYFAAVSDTQSVDNSENTTVSPTHDFQEAEEPIDIASEYESDFEVKFKPDVPVDLEIKKNIPPEVRRPVPEVRLHEKDGVETKRKSSSFKRHSNGL